MRSREPGHRAPVAIRASRGPSRFRRSSLTGATVNGARRVSEYEGQTDEFERWEYFHLAVHGLAMESAWFK
jgi:hypothetical protein